MHFVLKFICKIRTLLVKYSVGNLFELSGQADITAGITSGQIKFNLLDKAMQFILGTLAEIIFNSRLSVTPM